MTKKSAKSLKRQPSTPRLEHASSTEALLNVKKR